MSIVHLVISVVIIVALIIGIRLSPAFALLVGAGYLGLATGIAPGEVMTLITTGFGDFMAEVGLLIVLGVAIGAIMSATGSIRRIVSAVLGVFGRRGAPYAISVSIGTVMPAIFFDVLLVLMAPITRRMSRSAGVNVAVMAAPVSIGLMAGNAMVIPGSSALAYAGALEINAGTMLIFGLAVAVPAIVLTTIASTGLARRFWNPVRDEDAALTETDPTDSEDPADDHQVSLLGALAPILIAVALMLTGTFADRFGAAAEIVGFVTHPVTALFVGLVVALVIGLRRLSLRQLEGHGVKGLETAGPILVISGAGAAYGAVIAGSAVGSTLERLLTVEAVSPLIFAWVIAAILRMTQGGASVSGLTAIAIIAPVAMSLDIGSVWLALAAAAGACFGGNLTDNAFWMFKSLYRLSTSGTLKVYTLSQSIFAILGLIIVLVLQLTGVAAA